MTTIHENRFSIILCHLGIYLKHLPHKFDLEYIILSLIYRAIIIFDFDEHMGIVHADVKVLLCYPSTALGRGVLKVIDLKSEYNL